MELEDSLSKARIMLTDDLPDEAYQALRRVDLTEPELEGNVLVFDLVSGKWRPTPSIEAMRPPSTASPATPAPSQNRQIGALL